MFLQTLLVGAVDQLVGVQCIPGVSQFHGIDRPFLGDQRADVRVCGDALFKAEPIFGGQQFGERLVPGLWGMRIKLEAAPAHCGSQEENAASADSERSLPM